jgi:putative oxidoreductase
LIVAFLIPVTLSMHAFWTLRDAAAIHIQVSMFFKNLAMLGAALYITYFGSAPMSIDEALASRSLKGRPRA